MQKVRDGPIMEYADLPIQDRGSDSTRTYGKFTNLGGPPILYNYHILRIDNVRLPAILIRSLLWAQQISIITFRVSEVSKVS